MAKAVIALIVGMALMALCQYSVVQAPYGFNADAFGYLCYFTVATLDQLTVGLHLGGLRGAQVAANIVAMAEIVGIIAFILWFAVPGAIRDLPSRQEILCTVPAQWGRDKIAIIVIVPLIVVGVFYFLALNNFLTTSDTWSTSTTTVAVGTMVALVLLLIAIGRPRPQA